MTEMEEEVPETKIEIEEKEEPPPRQGMQTRSQSPKFWGTDSTRSL